MRSGRYFAVHSISHWLLTFVGIEMLMLFAALMFAIGRDERSFSPLRDIFPPEHPAISSIFLIENVLMATSFPSKTVVPL